MSASSFLSTSILQFFAAYVVMEIMPGPITFATGSRASFQGFGRTLPLLAGIGVGRVALVSLFAFGAVYLAASLSLPAVNIAGAVVLCAMAWRIARAAPPAGGDASTLDARQFAEGMLIGFVSPQAASLLAVAFIGLALESHAPVDWLSVTTLASVVTVGWYAVVAALFSRPIVRNAAIRHHCAIRRTAATTLCSMAVYSAMPLIAA